MKIKHKNKPTNRKKVFPLGKMSVESCSTSFASPSSQSQISQEETTPKLEQKPKEQKIKECQQTLSSSKSKINRPYLSSEKKYSLVLEKIICQNKRFPDYCQKVKNNKDGHFTCTVVPGISIFDYLKRIIKYTKIENSTLVLSMIYIIRICKKQIFVNEFNIHRIMLISIYLAYKYNEDCVFKNKYLALVSGVSLQEMTLLENEFLQIINYELFVDDKTFLQYQGYLQEE